MKKYIRYLRNEKGIKVGAVVTLKSEEGYYARGVSLCNDSDNFVRKTFKNDKGEVIVGGLNRAEGLAKRALKKKSSSKLIKRTEALMKSFEYEFKSQFAPKLSFQEDRVLNR